MPAGRRSSSSIVGELVGEAVAEGRLAATTSAAEAVAASAMSLVCVGTPSRRNGSLDTHAIERVCEEIGAAVRASDGSGSEGGAGGGGHLVVIRSTILPGTMRGLVIPALERASGHRAGEGFLKVANNPEFLREATAVYDYDNPPKTVVGSDDPAAGQAVLALYEELPGPKIATRLEVAEMVKYADNTWHAVKVAFANEIGNIAKAVRRRQLGGDGHLLPDRKLNISSYYLRPGFAFGGSCLPKDVRALGLQGAGARPPPAAPRRAAAHQRRPDRPRARPDRRQRPIARIAFLGISFKAGTDDLRESPQVALVERLIGKGYNLEDLRQERASGPALRRQPRLHRGGDPPHRRHSVGRPRRHGRPRRSDRDRQPRAGVQGSRGADARRPEGARPRARAGPEGGAGGAL
jgi:GDP-mannose 6-dehydrogenase